MARLQDSSMMALTEMQFIFAPYYGRRHRFSIIDFGAQFIVQYLEMDTILHALFTHTAPFFRFMNIEKLSLGTNVILGTIVLRNFFLNETKIA